jgi:hypothetical protein
VDIITDTAVISACIGCEAFQFNAKAIRRFFPPEDVTEIGDKDGRDAVNEVVESGDTRVTNPVVNSTKYPRRWSPAVTTPAEFSDITGA